MARPPKEGIDYAGWAVDIFDNDAKIDKLLDAQSAAGFLIYFYLCQRAYGSKGYFYEWSYDDAATTARKIGGGIGSQTVEQTVNLCFNIGLFDKGLFERHGIITSRGIQKRFWQVARDRTCNAVNMEYWLLSEKESPGLVKCTQNNSYQASKPDYSPAKPGFQPQKESKGKESKAKKSNAVMPVAEATSSLPVITLILNDKTQHPITQQNVDEWRELYPAVDIMQELRKMKGWLNSNPTRRKTRKGILRFVTNWLSGEQDKGRKATIPQKQNPSTKTGDSSIDMDKLQKCLYGGDV